MLALASVAALAACANAEPTDVASPPSSSPVTSAPAPTTSQPSPSAEPATSHAAPSTVVVTVTTSSVVTATVSAPPPATAVAQPGKPVTKQVSLGSTVSLRYFDVTVSDFQFNGDGTEAAARVKVCYTHPHPEANADGTTRVSTNPWSFGVRDPEGATSSKYTFVGIGEFDRADWSSPYREKRISVGECNAGWIAVHHGSPDLQFAYLRYAPRDFGDRITWELS